MMLALMLAAGEAGPARAQPSSPPLATPAAPTAPPAAAANDNSSDTTPNTLFEILNSAGLIGYTIVLLSVAAVALGIEQAVTVRRARLVPEELIESVQTLVQQGAYAKAQERCRARPCLLAHVLDVGLASAEEGWPAAEKAMEETLADEGARLLRRIEYLAVIGNLAPMLGLLGTVVGMIFAFREVAMSQGTARAADLAEGIYLALVTTVEGLVVAIPSLGAYAVFRNRSDGLLAEAARAAQQVLRPLRQSAGGPRLPRPERETL